MANTYRTKQGDTWDTISLSQYGSELYTNKLVAANYDYKDVLVFGAGTTLLIPALAEDEQQADNLPPWRRS